MVRAATLRHSLSRVASAASTSPSKRNCWSICASGMLGGIWWSMNPVILPSSKYDLTDWIYGSSLSSAPSTDGTMFWDAAKSSITSSWNR
jgi:hypothetical protein